MLPGFAGCRPLRWLRRSYSRTDAAESSGMNRQTLRDWVHRYNDERIDGLKSRSAPGRAPAPSAAQRAELKALVVNGPDPATHNVVRC